MDETRASYGTTSEVVITLADDIGQTKTIRLPNPKNIGEIETAAATFAALATNSDTGIIGLPSEADGGLSAPTKVTIDIVETTRTNVYGSNL